MQQRRREKCARRLEVTATWRGTVVEVAHLDEGEAFELGRDIAFEHPLVADAPRLAEVRGGELLVRRPPGVKLERLRAGAVETVEGAGTLRLVDGDRARLCVGELEVLLAAVEAAPALPAALRVDRQSWGSIGLAAALHASLLAIAFAVPLDEDQLALDRFSDRFIEIAYDHTPREPEVIETASSEAMAEEPIGDGLAVAASESTPAPGPALERPAPSRAERKAVAHAAAAQVGAALEAELGNLEMGAQAHAALNDLMGGDMGQSAALGGPSGPPGPGLGGPSARVGLDTRGRGWRAARGPSGGLGRPEAKKPTRRPKQPKLIPLDPTVEGGLAREEIRKVIRRHRREYLYCYEKQLQTKRELNGKISMRFTIGPDGRVSSALVAEDTMQDPAVNACLKRRMRTWQFPPPRGGVVVVRYPFLFKPS